MNPNELRQRAADSLRRAREMRATEGYDEAEYDRLIASAEADAAEADRVEGDQREASRRDAERRQREERLNSALGRADNAGRDDLGLPEGGREQEDRARRLASYSLMGALRDRLEQRAYTGVAGEEHAEIARRNPSRSARGIFLPLDLPIDLRAASRGARVLGVERRDFNTTAGAGLVENVTMMTVIEYLRSRMLARTLGARVLTGLVGQLDIPKQTGAHTAYWIAEGGEPTKSNATIGQVELRAKTVGAYTDLTRRMLNQTSYDVEMFNRMDLMDTIAHEFDRVVFNGSGSGNEPEGVLQNSSVPTVALGTNGDVPTWSTIVSMEQTVEASDGLVNAESAAYVMTPAMKGKLKRTEVTSGSGRLVWEYSPFLGAGSVNGYRAESSNKLPSNLTKNSGSNLSAAIFGDFSQVVIGMWSDIDVMLDPYSLSKSGGLRIVALMDADLVLRHTESFVKVVDAITT